MAAFAGRDVVADGPLPVAVATALLSRPQARRGTVAEAVAEAARLGRAMFQEGDVFAKLRQEADGPAGRVLCDAPARRTSWMPCARVAADFCGHAHAVLGEGRAAD